MRQNLFDSILTDSELRKKLRLWSYEERSGAGAASLEVVVSYWTSTGANVVTIADGEEGQIKIFIHAVDGGSVVLTPANMGGASNTTITMVTAGDCVGMIFLKGAWWLLWSTPNVEGTPLVIA